MGRNQGGLEPFPRTGCVPLAKMHPSRTGIARAISYFPLFFAPISDTLRHGSLFPSRKLRNIAVIAAHPRIQPFPVQSIPVQSIPAQSIPVQPILVHRSLAL